MMMTKTKKQKILERSIEAAVRSDAAKMRLDAGETAATVRALLYIQSTLYDIMYPEIKFRNLIPVSNEVDTGADSYAYRQWEKFGKAKIITNYADDLPMAGAQVKEFVAPVKSVGLGYQITLQDLRRVGFDGHRLDLQLPMATRRGIEEIFDQVACFGDTGSGLSGFTNNAACTIDAATSTWGPTAPQNADVVASDIAKLVTNIITTTKETVIPDTLALPLSTYVYLSQAPFKNSAGVITDKTILQWIMQANPFLKQCVPWYQLETAGAAGVKRAIAYKRDPLILQVHIPQEFEQMAPESRNLSWVVNCHGRTGGVSMHYPLGVRYMDGI